MHSIQPFQRLFKAVEALGGKTPVQFTAVFDTLAAYGEAMTSREYTGPSVMANVQAATETGQAPSTDEARDQLLRMAKAKLISEHGVDFRQVHVDTAILLGKMMRSSAGDELIKSLRPLVAEAIEGIEEAASHFGPDTTADQLVDMPVEAIAAFQAAKTKHAPLLERVLDTVVRPMTYSSHDMEVLPGQVYVEGPALLALWYVDPARAYYVDSTDDSRRGNIGLEFGKPLNAYPIPGGRWLVIHQACGLRLNTPSEAIAILNSLVQQRYGEDMDRYAGQTPRPEYDGNRPMPLDDTAEAEGPGSVGFEETVEIDPTAFASTS